MKTKRPKRLSGLREGQLTDIAEAIDRLNNRVRTLEHIQEKHSQGISNLECLQAPKTLQALEGRINELERSLAILRTVLRTPPDRTDMLCLRILLRLKNWLNLKCP